MNMITQYFAKRRIVDLDVLVRKHCDLNEELDRLFQDISAGKTSNDTASALLACVLLTAISGRASAIHLFYDEDDDALRIQCCCVDASECLVESTPTDENNRCITDANHDHHATFTAPDASGGRVWVELPPPPRGIVDRLFQRLLWHARMTPVSREGKLYIRRQNRELSFDVIATAPSDFRIYFDQSRPPIRPKLARHFEEVE